MKEKKIWKVRGAKTNRGREFVPEFIVECLPAEACKGNWAARNALDIEGYTISDAPFWYGKVGALGYIYSEKHLNQNPENQKTQSEGSND